MEVISVKNLTKDYGLGRGVFDVNLSAQKGEVYGFLGPNGAGKSTTIRHLMGFSKPDKGKTQILGKDTFKNYYKLLEKIGYLPGEIALPEGLTGDEFLKMMKELRHIKDDTLTKKLIKQFELDSSGDLKSMSLGQKRKLAIVTAFMHDPEILILDEPTSGLDPVMQEVFIQFIIDEKKRGKTILLSSHIFSEVDATCDRISIIIVLDDPISSFDMENKVGLFTFLRMMFNKIMNNNEGSKIISFTHSLETMFNLEKICSDIKINLNITYCLLELKNSKLEDFAYKRRNDYKKMLEDIYKYAKIEDDKIENELDDTIGNTMRKLLEAYSTFNYNKGIEEVTRNKNILEKVENEDIKQYFENFMYRLILNNESHTFDETRSLDFYDFISRDEKIKTARSILILLNILDNTHLKAYLDGEDYIKELKIWENEIIPKKTIAN